MHVAEFNLPADITFVDFGGRPGLRQPESVDHFRRVTEDGIHFCRPYEYVIVRPGRPDCAGDISYRIRIPPQAGIPSGRPCAIDS